MVDMQSIALAISSAKSITEIVKTLSEGGKQIEMNQIIIDLQSKVMALQSHLLSAQQEQSVLIKIKDQIEEELMQYKNWNIEKDRYEPFKTTCGTILYKLNSPKNDIEKEMYFCPNCMQINKPFILQCSEEIAHCTNCENSFPIVDTFGFSFGGVRHD